jgi:hypothetical protein
LHGAQAGGDATLRRLRTRVALGTIALAALLAGCGGDGSDDRLSEEEFRSQANAICADFNEKLNAVPAPESPEDIPEFVDRGIPLVEQGLAELRALNPPEELQEDYDAMLDEIAKQIPAGRALGEAAADEDPAAVQEAIAEGNRASQASDRLATQLGIEECAGGE